MIDPTLANLLEAAEVFSVPLRVPFRGVTHREGVVFRGPSGWGEFAPFLEYDDATAARWLASAVEAAWGHWPAAKRSEIPTNAIVPALAPAQSADLVRESFAMSGCQTVKVKVAETGGSLAADVARVAAVRAAQLAVNMPEPRIRIDANGAWSVAEALEAIRELEDVSGGLEYVEQPCASLVDMVEVRRKVNVPIAADESIRNAGDPLVVAKQGAADVIVVKVPPLAGVNLALCVCEAADVAVVVSSAMDTSVGLSAGLALAAALPELPYACGLGTGALLAEDLVAETTVAHGGLITVERACPDEESMRRATSRVGSEREMWWRERIVRAWEAGASDLASSWIRS